MPPPIVAKPFLISVINTISNSSTASPIIPKDGIVVRAHQTLKNQIFKVKKGEYYHLTPQNILNHTIFILNFLQVDNEGQSAAQRFWNPQARKFPEVYWRDPLTNDIHGPDPVLMLRRGYVCVFPTGDENPRWLPERCVCHASKSGGKVEGSTGPPAAGAI